MAGIKAVGIAALNTTPALPTTAAGVVNLAPSYGASTIARLEVKNSTVNYVENGAVGADNRSKGITGNLPLVLAVPKDADLEYAAMVEEMLKGEVCLFIERKDGTIVAAGSQNGALALTADDQTGGTIGDLNGFTLTFQTMEEAFSRGYLITGQGLTDYAAALMPYV